VTWLYLAVFTGAVFRLSWLITADKITEPVRDWTAATYGDDSLPAYLIRCLWCTSIWVTLVLTVPAWLLLDGTLAEWILAAFTASLITGAVGAPLYKHLTKEPPLGVEELAAEIHEAQRAVGIPGVPWLDAPAEYRHAMMGAVRDMKNRKIIE